MIDAVTSAVDTRSDAAICGSEGSRILVARVPVAASVGQNRDLQEGRGDLRTGSCVDRYGLVGHGNFPPEDDIMYII